MSQFDDRERAYEAKFAHDEEMNFRIVARRNRLVGEWAARKMELSEEETSSYAKDVVRPISKWRETTTSSARCWAT